MLRSCTLMMLAFVSLAASCATSQASAENAIRAGNNRARFLESRAKDFLEFNKYTQSAIRAGGEVEPDIEFRIGDRVVDRATFEEYGKQQAATYQNEANLVREKVQSVERLLRDLQEASSDENQKDASQKLQTETRALEDFLRKK